MEYTFLNQESAAKFEQIRKQILRLQSGGTIDSLRTLGVNTSGQVGASFVSLKSLASSHKADEKVAEMLWNQKRREEQIVACFLFSTDINKEKITQLASNSHSYEVAEYFGSIFLFKHPELKTITETWLNSPEPFLQVSALTAIARHLIIYKENGWASNDFFQQITAKKFDNKYVELVAERYRFNFNKC